MFDAIINERIDLGGMRFDVEYWDIEELNAGALAQRADISKVSCAMLPFIKDNYVLLSSGAALGRGNGPLFVRRGGDIAPIRRVAVPGVHTTAYALMRRLMGLDVEYVPMLFSDIARAVNEGDVDAGVLIHEGRFVYQSLGLELIADLGLLWEEQLKLPLPLGGIVMKRSISSEICLDFDMLLRESISYAMENPTASRDFIKSHAQECDDSVIESHIALFVNDFSLDLGAEGLKAVSELTRGLTL